MIEMHDVAAITAAEQAHADELASGRLMERAATAVAVEAAALLAEVRGGAYGSRAVLLVGSGNNGGDALHAGARLARRGIRVDALCTSSNVHAGGSAALATAGGRMLRWDPGDADQLALVNAADALIDGVVGIGARGALREPAASLIAVANAADALRVAVDLPSGIDADTGTVDGVAFDADLTVTFAATKPGLLIAPGREHAGQVSVIDIGIDDALGEPAVLAMQGIDVADCVPEPGVEDHKYVRGVVGITAGSMRYPGAALLCTGAALLADIGMVSYLDRADEVARMVVDRHPETVVVASTGTPRVTAWACGPGFEGIAGDAPAIESVLRTSLPVVLDAGALTVLASDASLRALIASRSAATVLTPHEGEFARLGGGLEAGRLRGAQALARTLDAVVVLKGPGTVIAAPDGTSFVDIAGTAALATAGSGDLLTGVIGSLLAGAQARGELTDVAEVARQAAAGCWIHGMAGRLAAEGGLPATAGSIGARVGAAVAAARRQPGE